MSVWHLTNKGFLQGRSHLDSLDTLAWEMEQKWGVGTLRLLVSPELRAAFDSQQVKVSKIAVNGTLEELIKEVERMKTAWTHLDQAATAEKKEPFRGPFYELGEINNTVAVIVKAGTKFEPKDDRSYTIYTDEEIVRMLHTWNSVHAVKELWPGAEVTATRLPKSPVLSVFDEEKGDDLPSMLAGG